MVQSKNRHLKAAEIWCCLQCWISFFFPKILCTLCHFLPLDHFLFSVSWVTCVYSHLTEPHQGSLGSIEGDTYLESPEFPCLDHSNSSYELSCFSKYSGLFKETTFNVDQRAPMWKRLDTFTDDMDAKKAKKKQWTSAKAHWWDDKDVEGEQAVNSVGAPVQVVSRFFLLPLRRICLQGEKWQNQRSTLFHSTPLLSLPDACLSAAAAGRLYNPSV